MGGMNMQCKFDQIILERYVDGTSTRLESIFVEEHVKVCTNCRDYLSELQWIVANMAELTEFNEHTQQSLAMLTMTTVNELFPKVRKNSVLDILKGQRDITAAATQFVWHMPGVHALTTISKKGLQSTPRLIWGAARQLYRGGAMLRRVLA